MQLLRPLIYLTKILWQQSIGNRKNVILYTAMFCLAYSIEALEPLLVGWFLNTLQTQGINSQSLPQLIFILLLFPLKEGLTWLFHGPGRMIEKRNAFYVKSKYKEYLLNGTLALPLEWHTDHHSGDTIDKIEKGATALEDFASQTFEILSTTIRLIVAITTLLVFNLQAGFLAAFFILFTFYILTRFDRILVPGYGKVNLMENKISAKVFDIISNITTVIILRVEKPVLNALKVAIQKPFLQFNYNNKINEWKWFSASILGRATVFFITLVYVFINMDQGKQILAGTVFIIYGYGSEIRDSFFRFAYKYGEIVRWRTKVANAEELSREFKDTLLSRSKNLPKNWNLLKINNLSFSYHKEDNTELHLDNISVEMKKGEKIALVGHSGGGKSTFLKILRDLYHPKTIQLTVDNKNLTGFSDISDSISLIPQDPEIFNTTIRENITLGIGYADSYIKKYTDIAQFSEVAERLPNGLESSIVEKGVNLSGGEKQRLAVSRGLVASENKEIILLDEPTSSVDFNNELMIYQNIFKAFPQKTIISSIHRLHLLSLFNTIYFFDEGKIVAQGNLDDLKNTSSQFSKLWNDYQAFNESTKD